MTNIVHKIHRVKALLQTRMSEKECEERTARVNISHYAHLASRKLNNAWYCVLCSLIFQRRLSYKGAENRVKFGIKIILQVSAIRI